MEHGVTIEDTSNRGQSLVAFEEMLEFLVIRLAQASDAMAPPGEDGELTFALRELSALMTGLAEDVVLETPAHRRALLRTSLPACLRAMLEQTYQGEAGTVVAVVKEVLRNVARAMAKVLPVTDGPELEGACESLLLLLDRRQAFYRHLAVPAGGAVPGLPGAQGMEGADLLSVLSEEDWRRGVGFADWVDAVSSESTESMADVRRWRRAQIVEESSTGRLRLSFENLSDFHDEWVSRDSSNIAPPGTRSGQQVEQWRNSLQRGSLVDALDPNNTWTNATVVDTRERMDAPVVIGVGPMGPIGGGSAEKGLDVLVSFRVYDEDGDKEEPMPERHDLAEDGGRYSAHGLPSAGAGGVAVGAGNKTPLNLSAAARREEAKARAAAASPGGLSTERQLCVAGIHGSAGRADASEQGVSTRADGEAGGSLGGVSEVVGASRGMVNAAGTGVHNAIAAPAAGGWGFTGRKEPGSVGSGRGHVDGVDGVGSSGGDADDGDGNGDTNSRRGRRYFGLFSRDEWISASSTRIEKLNSRAPWKNCWTEEAPVNDSSDPYLTDDGSRLVFAVPRAPVDGAPCLVDNINAFGQEGGFDNLIVRLSPHPPREEAMPAPLVEETLPPPGPPSAPTNANMPAAVEAVNSVVQTSPTPPLPPQGSSSATSASSEMFVAVNCAVAAPGAERDGQKPPLPPAARDVPLGAVRHALAAVASIRPLLARRVSKAVLERTATAVTAALKGASDSELRGLTRERLEGIMNGFREVLKRGHRSSDAFRRVEWLQLDLALKLYSCPFMERKLQGLKILADAVAASETPLSTSILQANSPALTPKELVEWLDDNSFVKALFAGHTQLIRRSGDVLGFLCRERALTVGHIDTIWAAGGGGQDKDRRICVHEVLRPLLYNLDMSLLERLVDKLRVQPADEVFEDTVTFIRDTAEATQQGGGAPAIKLLDLLWAMADDKSPYRPRIKANAAESILPVTGLRGLRGHRALTLKRCVENVEEGRAVVTSLKVLEAVLQNYPKDATSYEALSRREVIHRLEAESGLTELLLRELENYVARSRKGSSLAGKKGEAAFLARLSCPKGSRAAGVAAQAGGVKGGGSITDEAHLAQVKARLHTLEHIHDNSHLVLSTEQIKRLWACLGPNPGFTGPAPRSDGSDSSIEAGVGGGGTPGEVSTLLSWLSKACEACEGEGVGGMFEPGVAAELFKELIVSDGEKRDFAATKASPEWFACFQTFFFKVNRQAGRMCGPSDGIMVNSSGQATPREQFGVDAAEGMVLATGDGEGRRDTPPRDPDLPLDVAVIPSDLSGMRALWNIALEAEDAIVVDQATRFLNRTHQELAPELRSRIGEIREEYISTCMAYVETACASRQPPESSVYAGPEQEANATKRSTSTDQNNGSYDDGVYAEEPARLAESAARRQRSVVRALHLLEEFVDETEVTGTAFVRGHGARVRGPKVVLSLENKLPEPNRLASTFSLDMHSNSQVWELRRAVARKAIMHAKDVELKLIARGENGAGSTNNSDYGNGSERRSVEAVDRSNSRRLGDLGMRKGDVWVVTRRTGPAVGRARLLDGSGRLMPKAQAIFQQWFYDFQNPDGVMDRIGAARFIDSCCHDQCKPTDERVNKFFRNYDKVGDGRMRLDDFLRLFRDSCKDMPQVVWSNLRAHHYRDDLTRLSSYNVSSTQIDGVLGAAAPDGPEDSELRRTPKQDVELPLPRTIISRDRHSVQSLVEVLSIGGPAAAAAWRFLMRLPTNPEMLEGVQSLHGFRISGQGDAVEGGKTLGGATGGGGGERWKALLGPPGSHRMLYTLQIVDGVLDLMAAGAGVDEGSLPEADGEAILVEDEERLREREVRRHSMNPEQWITDFVRSGGFTEFLEAILASGLFGDSHPERMVDAQQACMALMLKVVRIFVVGMLSVSSQLAKTSPASERKEPAARKAEDKVRGGHGGEGTVLAGNDPTPMAAAATVDPEKVSVSVEASVETPAEGVLLPPSSSLRGDAGDSTAIGEGGKGGKDGKDGMPCISTEESETAASSPTGVMLQSYTGNGGGDGGGGEDLSPSGDPSTKSVVSEVCKRATLWSRLPQDVPSAVLGAVKVPDLQARLMGLVGVAADIADAATCSRTTRGRRLSGVSGVGRVPDAAVFSSDKTVHTSTPLELFGCVGEGAPADAMAEEALRLWVVVSRAPPGSWEPVCDEGDGRVARDCSEVGDRFSEEGPPIAQETAMDTPVLKAIFCTSDAIRLQLAQSLLTVCGNGSGIYGGLESKDHTGSGITQEEKQQEEQCSDEIPETTALIEVETNACRGSGSTDETSTRAAGDDLREYVVRLLVDSIPREDEAQEGRGMPMAVATVRVGEEEVDNRRALAGAARLRQREAKQRDCTQFFHVLCHLVEESIKLSSEKKRASKAGEGTADSLKHSDFDVDRLTSDIKERLLAHPCTESRGAKESDRDTLLVGLLKLGVTLVEACPGAALNFGEDLVGSLLEDFLFAPPTPASTASESLAPTRPKCKTVASRAMAYKLLAALCRPRLLTRADLGRRDLSGEGRKALDPSLNLRLLLEKGLRPLRQLLAKPDVWGYSPSLGERSTVGRVGLRNLGNTCYVNSCLQQLFMMEPLRNGLLSLGEGDTDSGSLVGELQKLFGHLALSEKQAVDPLPFLRTVKDLDGHAIDVSVQQDAQGFLLDLFDKLEAGLKNTPQSSLLMSTFEGRQITQLICPKPKATISGDNGSTVPMALTLGEEERGQEAGNGGDGGGDVVEEEGFDTRERGEAFMCISLEVKNMLGVEDALEKFTEKEIIEGYAWDDERKDVSIHKRTVLGKLPPNVVLHLNRFKMNLDTFQTEKVNTRFEFPARLDLEPFTKEGLAWRERLEVAGGRGPEDAKRLGLPGPYELHPRSYYTYRLRGVVVHTGTANQGHYFSYIRDPKLHATKSPSSGINGTSDEANNRCNAHTHTPVPPPTVLGSPPSSAADSATTSPSTTSLSTDDNSGHSGSAGGEDVRQPTTVGTAAAAAVSAATAPEGEINASSPSRSLEGDDGSADDRREGGYHWCEFNDTVVKEWAVEGRRGANEVAQGDTNSGGVGKVGGLSTDCFGGQQTMQQETDEYGWPRTLRKDNIQNAYLLFYERIDTSYGTVRQPASSTPRGDKQEDESFEGRSGSVHAPNETQDKAEREVTSFLAEAEAEAVPPAVFRAVWDENNKFLLDRQLYHPDMSNFVLEVMKAIRQLSAASFGRAGTTSTSVSLSSGSLEATHTGTTPTATAAHVSPDPPPEGATAMGDVAMSPGKTPFEQDGNGNGVDLVEGFLEWGVKYLLNNLARALDNDAFAPLVEQLQGLYDLRPDAAGAFLDEETEGGMQGMREMLLLCPDRSVRVAMKGFYLHLLGILAEREGDRYLHYDESPPSLQQLDASPHGDQPAAATIGGGTSSAVQGSGGITLAAGEGTRGGEVDRGRPSTRLGRVVAGWLSLLPDAARSWGRLEQFLELMEGVGNMGDRERDLLLNRGMVCRLSSFVLQEKSPLYDPQKRLPRMGHKTAPPRFSPLIRCLRALRAHSGETSRWQPRGAVQVESDTETASDSDGARSDNSASSMRAVKSMPVGPVVALSDNPSDPLALAGASTSTSTLPVDRESREAAAAVEAVRRLEAASTSAAPPAGAAGVPAAGTAVVGGSDEGDVCAGIRGKMSAKERSRSVALSPSCRRCLNCEALYELAFEEHHAPEAAADLMCSWAADGPKLLRPLSRLIVQGVDSTPYADIDSWLSALRGWLEINDTLKVERFQLTLGTSKQEPEPKLLVLMLLQKEKYEKWLFRVLLVLSELLAENADVGAYVSKLYSHEMMPCADWITRQILALMDTYSSLRGVGSGRVKEEDLLTIKENLSVYERKFFGQTAEERLFDIARRTKIGPAEGEPGVKRMDSCIDNGVQVEMLDWAAPAIMPLGPTESLVSRESSALKRFWRVTNHRMDSVSFTFNIDTTDKVCPNYHVPLGQEVKRLLKPRETAVIMEVDKLDLAVDFLPHPFKWVFEAIQAPSGTQAAPPAVDPPMPLPAPGLTGSDLLEQKAKLDGEDGEAARVALACEREEAAEAEAAAVAVAKKVHEEDLSEVVAVTAASLPVIPQEVVSKMQADGASSERKVGDAAASAAAAIAAAKEQAVFWEASRTRVGSNYGKVAIAVPDGDGDGVEETTIGEDEDGETVLFSRPDSTYSANSADGDHSVTDGNQTQEEDEKENRVNV
ncbi:unnamed protein product [Scytosiphon promiscuus]